MNFLTPAQKIKNIRKNLKMKQEDLAGESITRPFVSMLEAGKRGLSHETAKTIAEKFNRRAEMLNLDLHIDTEYILSSPSEDALKYCQEKLNNAESAVDLKDIIEISTEFKLNSIIVKSYQKLGDLCFKCNNYLDAFTNYNISLDLCKNINEKGLEVYLYNSIGNCKLKLLQYTDAIFYFERANYYSTIYDNNEIRRFSIYNLGLCFKKLNKLDTALNYLNDFLALCDKNSTSIECVYANILKANCYEMQNNLDESLSIYNHLIMQFSSPKDPLLSMVYNNLGLVYLKKNDCIKSLDYFNLAQKIRTDNDIHNLHHTIIEKSNVFIKQNLYSEAILLIKLGLEMANKINDTEYLIKGNYLLAQIYNILNDYDNLEKIYGSILNLLKDTKDTGQVLKLYNAMTIMYLKQNNLSKVENYLKISQIFIDECYNFDL